MEKQFREAMSRLAGAVNVVATYGEGGKAGITATAVVSVTDAPPTLLVCVNRNSELNSLIKQHQAFSVNILTQAQQSLSNRFAGFVPGISQAERFLEGQWEEKELGQPILADALAGLVCKLSAQQEVGSHTVFFGEVAAIYLGGEEKPLIYFKRGYL